MRVRVKICGIVTPEAAAAAVQAGADAVGFVFADSPRRVDVERAGEIARSLPPFVTRVAVFRYPRPHEVADVVRRLRPDLVQAEPVAGLREALVTGVAFLPVLHDGADLDRRAAELGQPALLLEAAGRGGRGVAPDPERAARLARRFRLVLAGGLTPENVAAAIRRVRPFAVDVSSGVESAPAIKDPERIGRFVDEVRRGCDAPAGVGDP